MEEITDKDLFVCDETVYDCEQVNIQKSEKKIEDTIEYDHIKVQELDIISNVFDQIQDKMKLSDLTIGTKTNFLKLFCSVNNN